MNRRLSDIEGEILLLGICSEKEYQEKKKSFQSRHGIDEKLMPDFFWSILNEISLSFARIATSEKDLLENQYRVYLVMFKVLIAENKSRSNLTKLMNENRIRQAMLLPYECDIQIISTNDCEYSKNFEEATIGCEEALQNFPIDYNLCKRKGGCICIASAIPKRDINDRLILKSETAPSISLLGKVKTWFKKKGPGRNPGR